MAMPADRNEQEFESFVGEMTPTDSMTRQKFNLDEDEEFVETEDVLSDEEEESEDGEPGSEDGDEEDGDEQPLKVANVELQRQVKMLTQKLEGLESLMSGTQKKVEPERDIDFLDGMPEDMDDIFTNKELVNKLFNKLATVVKERAVKEAASKVTPVVEDKIEYQKFVDNFFNERQDLKKFEKYFYQVAKDVANSNKSLTLSEVFKKAEVVTRKDLNLRKGAQQQPGQRRMTGAQPGKRSSKRDVRKGNSQLDQIMAIIS
jgi:hypothetical protein